jgi:hypothetical protein
MSNPLKLPPSRVARDEKRARGGQGGMQGLRQVFRLNRQSREEAECIRFTGI